MKHSPLWQRHEIINTLKTRQNHLLKLLLLNHGKTQVKSNSDILRDGILLAHAKKALLRSNNNLKYYNYDWQNSQASEKLCTMINM